MLKKYLSNIILIDYFVLFILMIPSFLFIILDKSLWNPDCYAYANQTLYLYKKIIGQHFYLWPRILLEGSMPHYPPMLYWIGIIFVPIGLKLASIDTGLLLVPLIASLISLILFFKSFYKIFKNKTTAYIGCFVIFSAPLFIFFSNLYYVEALQLLTVACFFYVLTHHSNWSLLFTIINVLALTAFGLLVKTTTPYYFFGPLVLIFWSSIAKKRISAKSFLDIISNPGKFLVIAVLFFLLYAVTSWYVLNFKIALPYLTYSFLVDTSRPLCYWSNVYYWINSLSNYFFQPLLGWAVPIIFIVLVLRNLSHRQESYGLPGLMFLVSSLYMLITIIIFSFSRNPDARFLAALLPYFAYLIAWGVDQLKNSKIRLFILMLFILKYALLNLYLFNINLLDIPKVDSYWPHAQLNIKQEEPVAFAERIVADIYALPGENPNKRVVVFFLKPGYANIGNYLRYVLAKNNLQKKLPAYSVMSLRDDLDWRISRGLSTKDNLYYLLKKTSDFNPDFLLLINRDFKYQEEPAKQVLYVKYFEILKSNYLSGGHVPEGNKDITVFKFINDLNYR